MPVTTKQVNGKWRVVEKATGKVVGHPSGKGPADGGGHGTRKAAMQQAAAINISMHKRGGI